MASVSADDIRYVINVSSAEVPDAKVLKMIWCASELPKVVFSERIDTALDALLDFTMHLS